MSQISIEIEIFFHQKFLYIIMKFFNSETIVEFLASIKGA